MRGFPAAKHRTGEDGDISSGDGAYLRACSTMVLSVNLRTDATVDITGRDNTQPRVWRSFLSDTGQLNICTRLAFLSRSGLHIE